MDDDLRKAALDYHLYPRPGKLSITPTKRMETSRDLALGLFARRGGPPAMRSARTLIRLSTTLPAAIWWG